MDPHRGTLGFLLLLPLTSCFSVQNVVLKSRIGSEAYVTPLCMADTWDFIIAVNCRVHKANNEDVLCRLRYIPGLQSESGCASRITLGTTENQTVFLNLRDLTPEDSGLVFCECYRKHGITKIQLNVTVEGFQAKEPEKIDDNDKKTNMNSTIVSSILAFIVISGVIMGVLYKKRCIRQQPQPALREEEEMEMDSYAKLQKSTNDLYQIIANRSSARRQHSGGEYANVKNNTK